MAIDGVIITVMIIILIGKPIKVFETMFYPKTYLGPYPTYWNILRKSINSN